MLKIFIDKMIKDQQITELALQLKGLAKNANIKVSCAESCTGGMLASYITSLGGASNFFDCSVVVYSNESKKKILKVNDDALQNYGAVSEEVAAQMASGVRRITSSEFAVSITGVAGPAGGTRKKPVGYVCIAVTSKEKVITASFNFSGTRDQIRKKACYKALKMLVSLVQNKLT